MAKEPTGDPSYAAEKFSLAVYSLATGRGAIKERLYHAFREFVAVAERDIPPELREDFRWIRESLTNKPASRTWMIRDKRQREGRINATLRGMRLAKAEEIATRIVTLADKLESSQAAA